MTGRGHAVVARATRHAARNACTRRTDRASPTAGLVGMRARCADDLECCAAQAPACEPVGADCTAHESETRRPSDMLYQLYEAQRALLSPFAEFASASSKLYNHPLSPFAHTPMAQRVSAGYELMYRLGKDYEKPRVRHHTRSTSTASTSRVQERVAIDKPFCRLLRFKRFSDDLPTLHAHEGPADGAGRRAAVGPPRDAAARHRARAAARPQGLHHRLDRRAHGAARSRARSTSTTTSHYVQEFIRHIGAATCT